MKFIKENRYVLLMVIILSFVSIVLSSLTLAYFNVDVPSESESTMMIEGAEIYANYDSSSTISLVDVEPSDNIIGYKDFSLEVKNTSSKDVSAYIYVSIDYSDYTDVSNDGVLYYELLSGSDTLVSKSMINPVSSGKSFIYEVKIPSGTESTIINYRLNIYFPISDKIQNLNKGEDGTMKFNAKIEITDTPLLSDYIVSLYNTESGKNYLKDDETVDHNIRYYGSGTNADDVPNYVSFNNELWRIIGVFDTYDADKQENVKAVKIIRNESLGNYSWDTSESSINSGYGVNAWNDADLMKELNGDYLDTSLTSNPKWFNEYNNATTTFDRTKVITDEYQQFIMNVRWYLGEYNSASVSASNMYTYERNNTYKTIPGTTCTTGTFCNDEVIRADYIDNLIGLAYPSDFGFAAKDNGSSNCSSNIGSSNCFKTYNWMSKGTGEWTISQYFNSSNAYTAFSWIGEGYLYGFYAYIGIGVRPVLYLSSDVLIDGGTGNSKDPYVIG